MEHENLFINKVEFVREMFINTADNNYILARYSFYNSYPFEFLWLAMHALEKYMKASLLLNGMSSKKYNHDLVALSKAVNEYAEELLQFSFEKPKDIKLNFVAEEWWLNEEPQNFIQKISNLGSPNNRYRTYGLLKTPDMIFKIDTLVYYYRRICRDLSKTIPIEGDDTKIFDILALDNSKWKIDRGILEDVLEDKDTKEKRKIFLKNNLIFAPDDFIHDSYAGGTYIFNSVIEPYLNEEKTNDDENVRTLKKEMRSWIKDNIQLPYTWKDLL